MCFHVKALTYLYLEHVDDDQVSRLPLPAPESMWSARTSAEWETERDEADWVGSSILTVERIIQGGVTLDGSHPSGNVHALISPKRL